MAKKSANIFSDPTSAFAGLNAELASRSLMPVDTSDRTCMVAIQVPSIALQYMLGTTGIPYSRMVQVVGSEGSYKSTFMYWLMSLYAKAGGYSILVETEAKDSGDIRNAILDWDLDLTNRVAVVSVTDSKAWMSSVTTALLHYKEAMEKARSYVPLFVGVDSVTATASAASLENINKEGYAAGSFPTLARDLSEYFKSLPSKVSDLPFTMSWINHVKPGTDSSLYSRGKIPGGKALAYYNSLTIHIGKKRTTESKSGTVTSILELTTWKNSWGRDGRKIDVNVVWYHNENDEVPIRCFFDWPAADITFLLKVCDSQDFGADLRDNLKSIVGLHGCKAGVKPGVWSDALGIPKDSPVTYAEAGKILWEKPDIINRIQRALYIKQLPEFPAGEDYIAFLNKERDHSSQKLRNMARGTFVPDDDEDPIEVESSNEVEPPFEEEEP